MSSLIRLNAIRDPSSRLIFIGQLLSQICEKMMSVGMIWIISSEFSAKWIPWFIAVGALPHLPMSAWSGSLVHRFSPLKTVIWTDFFRGMLFLLSALLAAGPLSGNGLLPLLFVSVFLSGIATSLFNPAILALPVQIFPKGGHEQLTALIDSCFAVGNILGPLFSVLIYSTLGLSGLLAINGISYLVSGFAAFRLPQTASAGSDVKSQASPSSAFTFLRNEPLIRNMLLTFLCMNLFLAPLMAFLPWYAQNTYHSGLGGFAKLETFMGIGTVIGSAVLSFVQIPGGSWIRIGLPLNLLGVCYLLFAVSKTLTQGCVALLLLGFSLAVANIMILTFFQSHPKQHEIPAIMGLVNLISVASLPISMALAGPLVLLFPATQITLLCSICVFVIAGFSFFIPGFRRVPA